MADYRDYGILNDTSRDEASVDTTRRSQVWQATHDGGGSLLPHRKRSFISFSFGGKNIEDFDLIACCKGDTMSRAGSADFEDLVTSYDIMDGQYYHGTHYKPNTLSLDLVTDGIDLLKLDDFLHWFSGGKIRELVLAEHPNRAIMARVASAPQIEMLPFEHKIEIIIGGVTYNTSTTLYKGSISLELVADEPFWYARQNILTYGANSDKKNKGIFAGTELVAGIDLFKEALKVVYEDNVPLDNMTLDTLHFGDDYYAIVESSLAHTLIAGPINANSPTTPPSDWDTLIADWGYFKNGDEYWMGARIDGSVVVGGTTTVYYGRIAGATVEKESSANVDLAPGDTHPYPFFYGGTAPSPTTLEFTVSLAPANGSDYINCIASEYAGATNYSTITIQSIHTKTFDFTTPNVITSWNKVRKILSETTADETNWGDLADTFRDLIRHPAVRAWAVGTVNYLKPSTANTENTYVNANGTIKEAFQTKSLELLPRFFLGNAGEWGTATFKFNAELGTATGDFSYWIAESSNYNVVAEVDALSGTHHAVYTHVQEDVGDMLRSNWLFIEDRNQIIDHQYVKKYSSSMPVSAHLLTHNLPVVIYGLKLKYKNRYL